MRAGQLRHQIVIQTPASTADGMGGSTVVWSELFKTRAAIWPTSSKERIDSMKLELEVTHKIRMRYRSGFTSKNRIKFGDRIFNIVSRIVPDERNIMIDLLCTEDI